MRVCVRVCVCAWVGELKVCGVRVSRSTSWAHIWHTFAALRYAKVCKCAFCLQLLVPDARLRIWAAGNEFSIIHPAQKRVFFCARTQFFCLMARFSAQGSAILSDFTPRIFRQLSKFWPQRPIFDLSSGPKACSGHFPHENTHFSHENTHFHGSAPYRDWLAACSDARSLSNFSIF